MRITFFIVGQDAALVKNQDSLKSIAQKGHEIGNHSFHHEPWLHLYSKDRIRNEILGAEEQIHRITGQKPTGFRGPGFVYSIDLLKVLAENGYLYDASILPTCLAPLARLYYFRRSNLTGEEKKRRKKIFGSLKDVILPVEPYLWQLNSRESILEIPVTTMPIMRIPFHLSYLIYLSRFSRNLMTLYLKTALRLCRITQTEPSFLLHPLDFLDSEEVPDLGFFPGMDIPRSRKMEHFLKVMGMLAEHFTLVDMKTHAEQLLERPDTKTIPC